MHKVITFKPLFLTILVVAVFSFARQEDQILVPATSEGKWGYIDRKGSWRIHAQFEQAVLFSEGLAAVRRSKVWGFIDKDGRERIPAQFGAVGNFMSGRAPVRVGRQWGYIDTSGNMIVKPQFQTASEFHDGLARVEFWDTVCGMTNEVAPEEYFDRKYSSMSVVPSLGCGAVNSRIGYVNREGSLAILPQYGDGSDFSEGTAVVTRSDWGARAYIDTTGKVVLPFQYAAAEPFSEGLASVVLLTDNDRGDQRAIVIDRSGKQAFARRFGVTARSFKYGLAPVQTLSPVLGWAYIDRTGQTAINTVFAQAFPFSEGFAVVWLGSKSNQAYIDTTGRIVFRAPSGGDAQPVQNGIFVVKLTDTSLRYFDKTGSAILPFPGQ